MNRRQLLTLTGALGLASLAPGCAIARPGGPAGQLADALVPAPSAGSTPLLSPLAAFTGNLTRRLAPKVDNLIWSPWSVAMVLAMVRDGAAGQTASEMTKVLAAGDDFDARLADGWRRMAHAAGEPLHAANAVWAQRGSTWNQPFLDKLAALAATMKLADFAASPTGAEREINAWVADHTASKITELLRRDVDSMTRLVLVNAVHFKAAWAEPFTELPAAPFAAPNRSVSAPYLRSPEPLSGWRGDGWTSASVPCQGMEFTLVVALPDDPAANPATLPVGALAAPASATDRAGQAAAVTLTMPAWKFRFRQELNDILSAAGMPTAFDPGAADFTPMTADERLFLGFVVHEAVVEVNAKGIEAAAATAAGMRASGMAAEPIQLTCDRPFAYALVHNESGTPLFVGQVADPTEES